MFRAHPTLHQGRDYGTVSGTGDWGHMVDVSLDEPISLIDRYISTPINSKRMLSVNDIRKIVQVSTDEIIASEQISGINNHSMKFAITLVHQYLCDSVRPALSEQQMERLIGEITKQLITHYHQSALTRKKLAELLAEDYIKAFIRKLATQPQPQPFGDARKGSENNKRNETGCFAWFWNLFW